MRIADALLLFTRRGDYPVLPISQRFDFMVHDSGCHEVVYETGLGMLVRIKMPQLAVHLSVACELEPIQRVELAVL